MNVTSGYPSPFGWSVHPLSPGLGKGPSSSSAAVKRPSGGYELPQKRRRSETETAIHRSITVVKFDGRVRAGGNRTYSAQDRISVRVNSKDLTTAGIRKAVHNEMQKRSVTADMILTDSTGVPLDDKTPADELRAPARKILAATKANYEKYFGSTSKTLQEKMTESPEKPRTESTFTRRSTPSSRSFAVSKEPETPDPRSPSASRASTAELDLWKDVQQSLYELREDLGHIRDTQHRHSRQMLRMEGELENINSTQETILDTIMVSVDRGGDPVQSNRSIARSSATHSPAITPSPPAEDPEIVVASESETELPTVGLRPLQ